MKALTMAGYGIKQAFRYRPNWFFVLIFPMLLIFIMGAAFGGAYVPEVGVVARDAGALGDDLTARLERNGALRVTRVEGEDELRTAVERGRLEAGLVVPAGYDRTLRSGGSVRLTFLARPDAMALRSTVASAVAGQDAVLRAARAASDQAGLPLDRALAVAGQVAAREPGIVVRVETAGTATFPATLGRFDLGAGSELVLFVFFTAMVSGTALIEARRLGVLRRMAATPTPAWVILLGQGLSRLALSLLQAAVIMLGSAWLFGVHWGDPVGAGLIVATFALCGSGAGMLIGATLRTEQQAVAVSVLLGMGMAALGGCMVPIEFFPDGMRTIAHLTPHAWALDGLAELVRHGAGATEVLAQAGVLLATAVALLTVATWRLHHAVTR